MMQYVVKPSSLAGNIIIPPSKSHTLRAILFASLAAGDSIIHNYLHSPDTDAMINACSLLGAAIRRHPKRLFITGTAGKLRTPDNIIDAGNSGQVLRFIAAIAALIPGYTILTGDDSIRHNRPIQPLLDALNELGVTAISTQQNGYAPIIIGGPFTGGVTQLNGEDSQPVSGLLMAAAFTKHKTVIQVDNPGETPWIELTLSWFKRLGIAYQNNDYRHYVMQGNAHYAGFEYTVPGDFSSAAFPLAAALLTGATLTLHNLDMDDVQGDKALIFALQAMGARIEINATNKSLLVEPSGVLNGTTIDVNAFIDAVPILAVLGCFGKGATVITGAEIARHKESDRLSAITAELRKMGADITENPEGLIIKPANLHGAAVISHHDHRIAMALAVAALKAEGETVIDDVTCVDKSFPHFAKVMQQIGAAIEVRS